MVKGLELFRNWFAGFEDCYVLIGGTACDLWMGVCTTWNELNAGPDAPVEL